jgi:acetoin utilization protein AcuB
MHGRDVMTKNPQTIHPNDTLQSALARMEACNSRHLPVVDDTGKLVGIVSDRDCRLALNSPTSLRYTWQDEEVTNRTSVMAMMTPAPITIEQDAPIQRAAEVMLTNHISALPVCEGEKLVGIVTSSDLLRQLINLGESED